MLFTRNRFFRGSLPLYVLRGMLAFCISLFLVTETSAQACPPNIDFEYGNFSNWECYVGNTVASGGQNIINLTPSGGPVYGRHTMYSEGSTEVDPFGGFPVLCPNGSGHSIRLGNALGGGEAEGIAYEFTIPANQNAYSFIYHYAVVFQSPNHLENEQPRMAIEVTNLTDNSVIDCASFSFIAMGSSLPGFQVSGVSDSTAVLYKDWSAVTVDLSGNAGKKIRIIFKTADCTFRRHFGYAYIDVDSDCSGSFAGATYCPDDTVVNITAPFGYQSYTWYDSTLNNVIGSGQNLRLVPPPPAGTTVAVKVDPYSGYGCTKTLTARLNDTLSVISNAGSDGLSCNQQPVKIGVPPKPGWVYTWSPSAGLSNPQIANPTAAPATTTNYVVKTNNAGGGCVTRDTVLIRSSIIDTSMQLVGKPTFCIDNGDSAILSVKPATTIQWYKNGNVLNGATQTTLRVSSSGTYYARLTNPDGCNVSSYKQNILMEKAIPGVTYPEKYALANTPLVLTARNFGENVVWSPGTFLNDPKSLSPTFTGSSDKLYTVKITTQAECVTVDTQLIKTIAGIEIYVPTAFSPNNDGRNDELHPILRGIKQLNYFRVYNRWGNMVFESKTEKPGWNGIYAGTAQSTQTVVWALECVGLDNKIYRQKGTSLLLR